MNVSYALEFPFLNEFQYTVSGLQFGRCANRKKSARFKQQASQDTRLVKNTEGAWLRTSVRVKITAGFARQIACGNPQIPKLDNTKNGSTDSDTHVASLNGTEIWLLSLAC